MPPSTFNVSWLQVQEMRRMVEFDCTSTWLVWAERDQTGAQYCTLLLNSKVPEQLTAECWHWCPRWNWLASSTSCFGSSACLQSLSSVLWKIAYGLESPVSKLHFGNKQNSHTLKPHIFSWMCITIVVYLFWCCKGSFNFAWHLCEKAGGFCRMHPQIRQLKKRWVLLELQLKMLKLNAYVVSRRHR